ncbi:MAG: alpha/beta hydrolase family esterase [Gemmataceae bacterium]
MITRAVFLLGVGVLLPSVAEAQSLRYELGRRLQRTEDVWAKHADKSAKKRAFKPLTSVFASFITGDFRGAGRNLDKTRYAILNKTPSDDQRWADSVMISVWPRLREVGQETIQVDLRALYESKVKMPENLSWRMGVAEIGKSAKFQKSKPLTRLPLRTKLETLPKGKSLVVVEIKSADKTLVRKKYPVYVIPNLKSRLTGLEKAIEKLAQKKKTTETETASMLLQRLVYIKDGYILETDYPADRLLSEVESIVQTVENGKRYYNKTRKGQFWLRVVTPKGRHDVRLFVPESAKSGKPVPMVVALHGVGGSENIFFDAYNRGELVRLCKRRGWMLMAPLTTGFSFTTPTPEIIDSLSHRYPIDRTKVFVLGHSMGAGQAIAVAQSHPERFAGVVALGGSRPVTEVKKIQAIPFLIGVGDKDFALGGAKRLAKDLKDGGVNSVGLHIYPNIEHIMVVIESYPDMMTFFDNIVRGKE